MRNATAELDIGSTRKEISMEKLIPADKLDWTQRQLDRILDEPDYHGPSRHFRNPLGEPLYDAARVRVAVRAVGAKCDLR